MTTQLSAQDQQLLNTDFGEETEKMAAAQVQACQEAYAYGCEKLAAETAEAIDKEKKEEKEEEEEKKKHHGKKEKMEDEESEKAAAELGAFIERGFFDGLRKLGSERHGNEFYYLEPYVEQKIAANLGETAKKVMEVIKIPAQGVSQYGSQALRQARQAITGKDIFKNALTGAERKQMAGAAAQNLGRAALKGSPYAAVAGGVGAAGYGASKLVGSKKEEQ